MPWPNDVSPELLVKILDLSSDASVLSLTAASWTWKGAVEDSRAMCNEGPWRHASGPWESVGLWRFLSLKDLNQIPDVTLCCEKVLQNAEEALAFFKAAKHLAADTVDGRGTFQMCSFETSDAVHLFSADEDADLGKNCVAEPTAGVLFEGREIECVLEAHHFPHDRSPWTNLIIQNREIEGLNPLVCCSSLLLPKLRLLSGISGCINIYTDHNLDADSPLTDLVRLSMPVPLFFGVRGLDDGSIC